MFHDLKENERHYNRVLQHKPSLYYERFDAAILRERPLVRDLLERTFDRFFPTPVDDMLDLGCGTAFYFPLLARHTKRLAGIDICEPMLAQAQQTIAEHQLEHCSVQRGSATELPFANHSFDTVHSWDFMHHVDDIDSVFSEIHRVLRPGGRFIAMEPNLLNPSIFWYHARRRSEWRLFLQNQFSLPRRLRPRFEVKLGYDNTIISFLNSRTYWIWRAANRFTSIYPFRILSFRYYLDCRSHPVA